MIPIAKPLLGKEEKEAVKKVIESGMISQGPKVQEFEEKFAHYLGVKYAIATSSGTTALHAALLANNIKEDDEVITMPFTFIATANSILYTGAKPIFADIEEDSFNIDPDLIEEKINRNTKAIIPVHLYGNPCNMEEIMKISSNNNLIVIEDCAHAPGAFIDDKKVGSFSTGCFSFYPTKNMTSGFGGMITTNDALINEKSRLIRDHGSKTRFHHTILGFNFKMGDINASIGIEQLKKLDNFNKLRRENSLYLNEKLKNVNWIITPKINKSHVVRQYTIRIKKNRSKIINILNEKGIGNSIFYPIPINKQKLYLDLDYKCKLPIAEQLSKEVLSLPIHPDVTKKDLDYIIKILKEIK